MRVQVVFILLGCYLQSANSQAVRCEPCVCCNEGKDSCLQPGSECTTCLDGWWGGVCRNKCPPYCTACAKEPVTGYISYHVCTKCVDGKYLGSTNQTKNCQTDCETKNCKTCTTVDICDECLAGFYKNGNLCSSCKYNCDTCLSGSACSTCASGYYGANCDNCSVGCKNNICEKDTGNCNCSTGFSGIKCSQCEAGYYGDNCNTACNAGCLNECNRNTGHCYPCVSSQYTGDSCELCINGTYGSMCNLSCPERCKDKICKRNTGNCLNCTGNFKGDICDLCISGKYGFQCSLDCPRNCKDHICTKVEGNCLNCSEKFTGQKCDQCLPGFYSDNCSLSCLSRNCLQNTCNKTTGFCKDCTIGWFREFCNQTCPNGCKNGTCYKQSGSCTFGCVDNYSGDKCCVENLGCLNCSSPTECSACVKGFYGAHCNLNCTSTCKDGCSKTSGECYGCIKNTYGLFCNGTCSYTCIPKETSTSCNERSGVCLIGCAESFYGDTCVDKCFETCTDNTCDREQGTCLKQGQDPSGIVAPAAGGAVGGVAIIAAVVIAVFCYRKRRSPRKMNYTDDGYANAFDVSLEHSRKEDTDYRKAPSSTSLESNKQNAKSKHKSKELEDPTEDIIDKEDEVPDYATASDKDAYYNVTLKVKVSELYGYVTRKSIEQYKQEFKLLPKELTKPHTYARKPENIKKNRYAGIYPYDETRVTVTGDPHFFINANYIRGYKKEKGYIASLGPTKVATEDFQTFWKMVWHEKSDVIVMLTNLQELSGMKCERYWPNLEHPESYGNITVTCQSEEVLAEYTVRTFTISQKKETRTLTQFHFTAWPDKGVPDHVVSLVEFCQRVKSYTRRTGGPDIVHCSAGIGRTGTFIAIDRLTQEGKADGSVNVYGCILDMREQRVSMVQTQEQFIFLHQALVYTLVLESEAVRAETFHQHVNSLTSATFAHYFQLLQNTVEDEHEDEKDARARNATNKAVNRAGADVPGDLHRPRLHFSKSFNESDYTNATFINGLKRKNAFIVAQTPLPASLEDFVTLLYQEECPCIVSLEDEPFNRKDVGVYLPADNQALTVGHFKLTSTRCESKPKYLMRKLTIQYADKAKEKKTMHHFQYTGWSKDKHTPEEPQQFLQFINDVKWKAATGNAVQDNKAILVHCLNAYSRSGLFCTVAVVTEKLQAENQVSIPNTIRQIRTRRNGAITNKDQLEFCYRCATVYLEQFATYTNFAS